MNDICWGLASLVYVAVYGRMGTPEVATIQICNTINNLFLVVIFGLSSAAAVMVGNSIGEGKELLVREYAKRYSVISVKVGLALGLVIAVASPLMLNFFNVSDIVKKSSQLFLIISAVFFIRVLGIMLIVAFYARVGCGECIYRRFYHVVYWRTINCSRRVCFSFSGTYSISLL